METKVYYHITTSPVSKEQADLISSAKNESDYDELVNKGLATRYIESADAVFTKQISQLTKLQKVRLLLKLILKLS